jgi:hypothetical protein
LELAFECQVRDEFQIRAYICWRLESEVSTFYHVPIHVPLSKRVSRVSILCHDINRVNKGPQIGYLRGVKRSSFTSLYFTFVFYRSCLFMGLAPKPPGLAALEKIIDYNNCAFLHV